jgi:hypothetical protein
MATPQQTADEALARWQALRNAGLTPDERIERLFRDCFSPPSECDVLYDATMREVTAIMEGA